MEMKQQNIEELNAEIKKVGGTTSSTTTSTRQVVRWYNGVYMVVRWYGGTAVGWDGGSWCVVVCVVMCVVVCVLLCVHWCV